jgi:hypothetical protein
MPGKLTHKRRTGGPGGFRPGSGRKSGDVPDIRLRKPRAVTIPDLVWDKVVAEAGKGGISRYVEYCLRKELGMSLDF